MAKQLDSTNSFIVSGWMVTDLHLEGMELMVFSIVHTFSQGRAGKYTGGTSYICDWFGITKPTALKYLQSLTQKGFIEREEKVINGVVFVEYVTGKEFLRGVKNFNRGVKNFYPNNNSNIPPVSDISTKVDISNTTPQGVSRSKANPVIKKFLAYGVDENDLRDWKTARKGAAITDAVFNGMKREADKAGITLAEAVRICAENSWRGFRAEYLDKKGGRNNDSTGTFMGDINRTYAKLQERWAARMEGYEQ